MTKRYFIELSRKDISLVSYFPGTEARDGPTVDWIGAVMIPAALGLAKLRSAAIREVPITFWIAVRPTARHRAEIFLFVTPGRPLARMKQAVESVLNPIQGGNVNAGLEPIPEQATPFCQVFRGKVMRLYTVEAGTDRGRWMPMVLWRDGGPKVVFGQIQVDGINEVSDDNKQMLVEARLNSVSSGEYLREFRQVRNTVVREEG